LFLERGTEITEKQMGAEKGTGRSKVISRRGNCLKLPKSKESTKTKDLGPDSKELHWAWVARDVNYQQTICRGAARGLCSGCTLCQINRRRWLMI
jgi:hypothetical protein